MTALEYRYSLCPARLIFGILLSLLLAAGLLVSLIHIGLSHPVFFWSALVGAVLLFLFGVLGLTYKVLHQQDLLIISPQGLKVNFTGLGRSTEIPWENVLYAKYYAFSVDQYALGIALKDPASWISALSLPEKAFVKIASAMGQPAVNIQQNMVHEPLSDAVSIMKQYVAFDDEMIFHLEHPETKRKKNRWIA